MIIIGLLLASVFIFRLQPPLAVAPAQTLTIAAQPGTASVVMPNGAASDELNFSPANVTVVIGVNNTVVWTNQDVTNHTVVSKQVPSGAASFSSSLIPPGGHYNVTLTVPGTYLYFCSIHPVWMQASITVKASSGPPSGVIVIMPSGVGSSNNLNFQPSTITVVIGVNNTVTWTNEDVATHTVTSTNQTFNSGDITSGKSWTYTFNTPGTFHYLCIYHSWMQGTVVVKQDG